MSEPDSRDSAPVAGRWTRWDTLALGFLTLVTVVVRLVRLSVPHTFIFDEVYYAKDACLYVVHSTKQCGISTEITWVHPPLGKWLIGVGIKIFGFTSFGYRIVPLVAGTIAVILMYLVARKLFKSTLGATFAAGLLAFDCMEFVQSRTSMLDIFVPMFGLAGFWFLLKDRDVMAGRATTRGGGVGALFGNRWWRLGAGIMLGAAVASKWNGALLLLAALVITVAWEIAARRSSGQEPEMAIARTMTRESASILLLLIVVPLLVYGLSYIGRIGDLDLETYCDTYAPGPHCGAVQHESSVRKIVDLQVYMANFHRSLETPHSYESPPWSWLLLKRPVSYYFCPGGEACPSHLDGRYAETMTLGSPFAWWSSLIALVFIAVTLAYSWIDAAKRRGEPAWLKPEGLIFGGFAFSYLPWLFLANNRPAQFIFYALPAVPFMCLALAYVVVNLGRSWQARTAMTVFGAMTVAMFAFYYPITSALPISSAAWQQRIWIFDDCDVTKTHPTTTVVTSTSAGATITQTETSQTTASEPPDGWCWI